MIARTQHDLFQPLLYQVATGILSEGEIAPATGANTVVASVPVGSTPAGVVISRDGGSVYVTNAGDSSVSVEGVAHSEVITVWYFRCHQTSYAKNCGPRSTSHDSMTLECVVVDQGYAAGTFGAVDASQRRHEDAVGSAVHRVRA